MKDYELSVLFHPDLEMNLDPALDKVKKLITSNGGTIVKEELDGKKRMAYQIKGQDYAVYYFFDVQLPPEAPAKIDSTLKITDEVLRAFVVQTDPAKARYAAKRAELEAAEAAKAEETNTEEEK